MDNKNKVVASIQGVDYTIAGDAEQEYINEISSIVNDMFVEVKRSSPFMNKNLTSVLCCLNLADKVKQMEKKIDNLESKINTQENIHELTEEISNLKDYANMNIKISKELSIEKDSLVKQLNKQKDIIEKNNNKIKQYKFDLEESRKTILDLQNQLFESQIELVKANKKTNLNME